MITNISHDLRTPLTSALGYINILLSSYEPETPEQLKIIKERLKRLEELIDSFFAFSRVTLQEDPLLLDLHKNKNPFQIMFTNELSDPDLDVKHIFDAFYTLDIARTKGNTGLGLAIAKEFMENLGGSIYAEKNRIR